MQRLQNPSELRQWRSSQGGELAFVPTMGYLHEGHAHLMRAAKAINNQRLMVSIFVNPTQFDRAEDLDNYPVDLAGDLALCERLGVDAVFLPKAEDLYRAGRSIQIHETNLSKSLCGATRPGHFDGVCLILTKLFNLVQPQRAYFGKKDYQQLAVVRQLVRDLDFPIEIEGVETQRAEDGLALSSRNARLTQQQRQHAPLIYQALQAGKTLFTSGETRPSAILDRVRVVIAAWPEARLDYLELVDRDSLASVNQANSHSLLALAAFVGSVRLIDNIEFS